MKAFPKARILMSAGLFLTICAATVNGALASKLTAYVCTEEDQDASSQFSNSNGGQQLVVTTAANGDASAGAVVSSVEGNEIFQISPSKHPDLLVLPKVLMYTSMVLTQQAGQLHCHLLTDKTK